MFWRLRDLRVPGTVALGGAALALVVVDSVVAGTRGGSPAAPPAPPVPHVSARLGMLPGVITESVAAGRGRIWALVDKPSAHRDRFYVYGIDPATNAVRSTVRVPGPASYVFYGARHVWVSGGGDGGAPNSKISAVDPARLTIATVRLGRDSAVSSIAFHGSTAYAAAAGRDQVLAIKAGKRLRVKRIAERGGPIDVVAVHGAIEVTDGVRNLVPVILRGANTSFLAEVSRLRPVFAAAGRRAVWVRSARRLIRVSVVGGKVGVRTQVPTGSRVFGMVTTPGGGCYVAVASRGAHHPRRNLLYFSPTALRARHPHPTAVHHGRTVNHLALDPAGGVVYADAAGKLRRWIPRATSLR